MTKVHEIQKRIKNKKTEEVKKEPKNNKLKIFFMKLLIIVSTVLILTIVIKNNSSFKNKIYKYVYNTNFSFSSIKKIYNEHIGNVLPFQNVFKEKKVFSEKLEYKSLNVYNKGVKLTLNDNYAIPAIKGGIVIFVGEKENMGNTIIVQQSDGIDTWYGNLSNINLKLYDYIEDNSIIGEAKNNELYLMFQKDGVDVSYKDVLKENKNK